MPKMEKKQGGCHTEKTRDMFQPSFSKAKCELLRPGQSGVLRISPSSSKKRWIFRIETVITMQARSGELWWSTLADDSYSSSFCLLPKHVTLSEKMRLALLVSFPASCFFDKQGQHDKNLKGDICGCPNWDWKISKQSLSFLNIARRRDTTQSDFRLFYWTFLEPLACMAVIDIPTWLTFMRAGGR